MKRFMMTLALAGSLIFTSATIQQAQAEDQMIGTIIGAVGGGLLGSTIGKGDGRLVATAAGTFIGAVLGHEITREDTHYRTTRNDDRDFDYRKPRTRVVYREVEPRPKSHKKWKRTAHYDGDVLICNKNGKRCYWDD